MLVTADSGLVKPNRIFVGIIPPSLGSAALTRHFWQISGQPLFAFSRLLSNLPALRSARSRMSQARRNRLRIILR
jgi:hypothetical protein